MCERLHDLVLGAVSLYKTNQYHLLQLSTELYRTVNSKAQVQVRFPK
jgi:hypothetical protein